MSSFSSIVILVLSLPILGCDSELMINPGNMQEHDKTSIEGFVNHSARNGDEVIVLGRNLTSDIEVVVDEQPRTLKLIDSERASFVLPDEIGDSLLQVTFKKGSRILATLPLMNEDAVASLPVLPVPLAMVCSSFIFKDAQGQLVRGEASCGRQLPTCAEDGQSNCIATDDVPGVLKLGLASKVLQGQTVAGVSGSAPLRPDDCSIDGAVDCVAIPTFPAADISAIAATDIRSGRSLAGIVGSLSGIPPVCSADGQTSCVAVANFPAIDKLNALMINASKIRTGVTLAGVSGTLDSCSSDGGTGCVALGPTYAAAQLAGAAGKILSGQTLAGVSGTVMPRPTDCSSDGEISCVAVSGYPAASKTHLSNNAAKIRDTLSIAGVTGTLSSCTSDGGTDCVAVSNFPSVDKAFLSANAGKISTTLSLASVAGTLPSCASDGATQCIAVSNYPAIDKSAAAGKILVGQNLAGIAGTASGRPSDCASDGGLDCVAVASYPAFQASTAAGKIVSGQAVGGVSGTAPMRPADCSSDGDISCVAVGNFPAVDKLGLIAHSNKMRSSLSIAGVAGTLAECVVDAEENCVASSAFPAMDSSVAASRIASGLTLAGVLGTAPARPVDCASDGATSCVAVSNFPAMDKSVAAGKILNGQTLAGVAGNAAGRPSDCQADGSIGCVAIAAFPAMEAASAAAKILSGQSIASVAGTAPLRPADCANDAEISCVAIPDYPAVKKSDLISHASKLRDTVQIAGVTGTLVDCSADGEEGCVVIGPSYAAALLSGANSKIAAGQSLAGINGSAPTRPADCATDGGTNCVAVVNYPAAQASTAAAKIVSGQSVAGINGSASGVRPADCLADGELGCVSIAGFPAMQVAGAASKIAAGDTLAGVSGTASVRPSDCSMDGDTACVAVSNYPAVDKNLLTTNAAKIQTSLSLAGVSGTLANCSTDGATACVAVAAYPAARVVGSGAKILTGQSVAGISGSAAVKPADCAADGATACVAVSNYPAIDKNVLIANANKIRTSLSIASVSGTLANCVADGSTGCVAVAGFSAANTTGAAAKILSGQILAGISGTGDGRPADCSSDGSTECVAVTNYPSVDKNALTTGASSIRSSLSVAGVTGTLPNCSVDGGTSCVAIAAYPAANSSGAAAKILTGQTLGGISGAAAGKPADCSIDGGTNCVAVANYPSVDKSALTANAHKIRSSLSLASVAGTLGDCAADGGTACVAVAAFPAANASGAAAKILSGSILAGISGSAAIRPADCATDGGTACVAVANYPSVDKVALTANATHIRRSLSIAQVDGTLDDCSADGGTSCVAVTGFPAATAAGAAAKISVGQTLAGIAGTAPLKPSDCAVDGGTGCVAVNAFPAIDKALLTANAGKLRSSLSLASVTGTLADCSADGGTNCVAVAAFPAALGSGAAAKILTGQTLAGINGSAALRPSDCASDGGTGCVAVADYPAVNKTALIGHAGSIRSGVSVAAVNGSLGNCASDGGIDCVAVANFPAADKVNKLLAKNIRNGVVVGGVTGLFPSTTHRLSDSDNSIPSLDTATFAARIKSSASFEFWDSAGGYHTRAGDADLTDSNIKSGVDIFGSSGTFGSSCSADGQVDCLATAPYKAMNTTSVSEWDIRRGKVAGGISGKLDYYKSVALLSSYNRTGTGSSSSTTAADIYDTIDDYAMTASALAPPGFTLGTVAGENWVREPNSDSNGNAVCDGGEACIFQDRLTGLYWSAPTASTYTWEQAISHCENSTVGGHGDWRLPSQKEMFQVFINGVQTQKAANKLNLSSAYFWSASTLSYSTGNAWAVFINTGWTGGETKGTSYRAICARGGW